MAWPAGKWQCNCQYFTYLCCCTVFARSLSPIKSLNLGVGTLMFSLVLLALCMISQWSPLFFISDLLVGAGYGLGLMGAFGLIHSMTHERNRAAVMSTYLLSVI